MKKSNSKLIERVGDLEFGLEDLEQYGRRTSLRFHNVPHENCADDTDSVVVKICQEMGVNINTDDINRSHPISRPIGRPRNNKRQIICRFRNWKIKNKIYSAKNQLKSNSSNIFVTKDSTKYWQNIVSKIIEAIRPRLFIAFGHMTGVFSLNWDLSITDTKSPRWTIYTVFLKQNNSPVLPDARMCSKFFSSTSDIVIVYTKI